MDGSATGNARTQKKGPSEAPGSIRDFAYNLFGRWVYKYIAEPHVLPDLEENLKQSGLRIPFVEYVSLALFAGIVGFAVSTIFLVLLVGLILHNILTGLLVGMLGGIIVFALVLALFYVYPSVYIDERKKNIEGQLPFAVLYLSTMAGGGTPPIAMFRMLTRFDFGEISKEARTLLEEVEVLGINIHDAIANAARRTPSEKFQELLWGMRTVLLSGGDLREYFKDKAVEALKFYKRKLQAFEKSLSMLVQMYITLVVVGSVFVIIITAIIGSMSGKSMEAIIAIGQVLLVFLVLPLASIGFMIFVKSISPKAV